MTASAPPPAPAAPTATTAPAAPPTPPASAPTTSAAAPAAPPAGTSLPIVYVTNTATTTKTIYIESSTSTPPPPAPTNQTATPAEIERETTTVYVTSTTTLSNSSLTAAPSAPGASAPVANATSTDYWVSGPNEYPTHTHVSTGKACNATLTVTSTNTAVPSNTGAPSNTATPPPAARSSEPPVTAAPSSTGAAPGGSGFTYPTASTAPSNPPPSKAPTGPATSAVPTSAKPLPSFSTYSTNPFGFMTESKSLAASPSSSVASLATPPGTPAPTPTTTMRSETPAPAKPTQPRMTTNPPEPAKPTQQSSTAVVVVPVTQRNYFAGQPVPRTIAHASASAPAKRAMPLGKVHRETRSTPAPGTTAGVFIPRPNTESIAHATPLPSQSPTRGSSPNPNGPRPTPSNTPKGSPSPTTKPAASPTTTGGGNVKTTVLSKDPRCPYPYPSIHCGAPTTLVTTETKASETMASETKSGQSKSTTWEGNKLTWKQTLVLVLSGEVTITATSHPVLETLTVIRSQEVVTRAKPGVESTVITPWSDPAGNMVITTVPEPTADSTCVNVSWAEQR